jgi:hypothetical protein
MPLRELHVLPHTPHWFTSEAELTSQPLFGAPSQSLKEPTQANTWQLPTVQLQSSTFCAAVYLLAHSSLTFVTSSITPSQSSSLALQTSICEPGATSGTQVDTPIEHCVLPVAQMPGFCVSHTSPLTAAASSIVPLQSLSLPSQVSEDGNTVWVQPFWPPRQLVWPWAQGVLGFCPVTVQGWPVPGKPSSTVPLQSSSSPLQVSVAGCRFCLHTFWAPSHTIAPAEQIPGLPVLHVSPTSPGSSSIAPSQSLSLPSQISGIAGKLPVHLSCPAVQCVVPDAHSPSLPGTLHGSPPPGSPSSFTPLQLSSTPLQDSGICSHGVPSSATSPTCASPGSAPSSAASPGWLPSGRLPSGMTCVSAELSFCSAPSGTLVS